MRSFRLLPIAQQELDSSADFYDKQQDGLGYEFLLEVKHAISRICDFPESWAPASGGFRRYKLRKFPFFLIYSIEFDMIAIVSVFHQSREPKSWRKNLDSE